MALVRTGAVLVTGLLLFASAGCADGPAKPAALTDPCLLITDELLSRLAPGSVRETVSNLDNDSGSMRCTVDLTSGPASMRGDLEVSVAIDGNDGYDDRWRSDSCGRVGGKPTSDGPGDTSCLIVTPWDGGESRIDGWAWIGDDYEANVVYQLVEPQDLPSTAEQDLRALLAAAVDSLPAR
jgi:hypothetical protein